MRCNPEKEAALLQFTHHLQYEKYTCIQYGLSEAFHKRLQFEN